MWHNCFTSKKASQIASLIMLHKLTLSDCTVIMVLILPFPLSLYYRFEQADTDTVTDQGGSDHRRGPSGTTRCHGHGGGGSTLYVSDMSI